MQRYVAADLRDAMRRVREAQGPGAVILSHRKVPEGVEVVAALDADSAVSIAVPPLPAEPPQGLRRELAALRGLLAEPADGAATAVTAAVQGRLLALGLERGLVGQLVAEAAVATELEQGWRLALERLARLLPVDDDPILGAGGVVALVGPTGGGKSTTLAKLAARATHAFGQRQVALVTTDSYRIGAYEQLQRYGHLLQVPVHSAGTPAELRRTLASLEGRRLVLVDTPGMGQRDPRLAGQLAELADAVPALRPYLVLPATAQGALLDEVVRSYAPLRPEGVILSKLDEAASLGGLFSVVIRQRLPLAYVGTGQQVPEDLRPARTEELVSRAVECMVQEEERGENGCLQLGFGRAAEHEHV